MHKKTERKQGALALLGLDFGYFLQARFLQCLSMQTILSGQFKPLR